MKPMEDNQRQSGSQHTNGQAVKHRILQTISEEAFSEDKGSVSNRSESAQNTTNRIRKNLSEQNINSHREEEKSRTQRQHHQVLRNSAHLIEDYPFKNDPYPGSGFQKNRIYTHRPLIENYSHIQPYQCFQCTYYLNKIGQLQSSYQLLLLAKNQQLQECKLIIKGLQDKLRQIQKRSLQEIEKNKKFRTQLERRTNEEQYHRERENEMIEYLKNREIVLLEQMKQLENKIFLKDIKTKALIIGNSANNSISKQNNINMNLNTNNRSVDSNKRPHFNSKGFTPDNNNNHHNHNKHKHHKQNHNQYDQNMSRSQQSAKTFSQHQSDLNQNQPHFSSQNQFQSLGKNELYSSAATRMTLELIQRVPFNEILKKTNQIESLKDNLLVSQLKIKIQQTKTLENLLFPR